jgi:transposase
MPRPRKYPPELLDRGARLVFERNRPIAHVARDLGVPSETLRDRAGSGRNSFTVLPEC